MHVSAVFLRCLVRGLASVLAFIIHSLSLVVIVTQGFPWISDGLGVMCAIVLRNCPLRRALQHVLLSGCLGES